MKIRKDSWYARFVISHPHIGRWLVWFHRPIVMRRVSRGFITRFHPLESFNTLCYIYLPGEFLIDGDAIPYYIDRYEYYGYYAPNGSITYRAYMTRKYS